MNGYKSTSIFCYFLVFYVLIAAGCAPSFPLQMPERQPPIIKEYKYIEILGITDNQGVNTGIYLNEGETYSVLATGGLMSYHAGALDLNVDFSLEARIGKNPYFNPLSGTHYGLNGTTRIANSEGNLYLGLNNSGLGHYRFGTILDGKRGHGHVAVFIIVWKTNNMDQIVGFLQEMKEANKNKYDANNKYIRAIDDAIDQVKRLRQDVGFRTLDFGFAPGIVCVKNYRRVKP